jgi:hypothetical protein
MTTTEQQAALAGAVGRIISQRFFLTSWEANLVASALGFCSASQVLQQQKILRSDPQAVAQLVAATPQVVNDNLF